MTTRSAALFAGDSCNSCVGEGLLLAAFNVVSSLACALLLASPRLRGFLRLLVRLLLPIFPFPFFCYGGYPLAAVAVLLPFCQ